MGVAFLLGACGMSCTRKQGTWGVGVPGGIGLSAPFEISPTAEWFRARFGGKGKKSKKSLTPLQKLCQEVIVPSWQDPAALRLVSWLKESMPVDARPSARAGAAFALLESVGLRYDRGPGELKELTGEINTFKDILGPAQVLSLRVGGRDDLVVLLASMLRGCGAETGLARKEGAGLRLLVREENAVLLVNPTSLGKLGFFAGAELKPEIQDKEFDEVLWIKEGLSADVALPASEPAPCAKVKARMKAWTAGPEDADLAALALAGAPACEETGADPP